jgi:hypothetical protein
MSTKCSVHGAEVAVAEGAVVADDVLPQLGTLGTGVVPRAAHGDELARDDLVQVGIKGTVPVELVLQIESSFIEINPSHFFGPD